MYKLLHPCSREASTYFLFSSLFTSYPSPYNSSYFRFSCFFIRYIWTYTWLNNAKIEYRLISYSDFLCLIFWNVFCFQFWSLQKFFWEWSSTFCSDYSIICCHTSKSEKIFLSFFLSFKFVFWNKIYFYSSRQNSWSV